MLRLIAFLQSDQTLIACTTCDARHEKTDLKVFVVVIPKEGLAGCGPTNTSVGMTPTTKYYSTAFIDYTL